jgi:hypothetical protein
MNSAVKRVCRVCGNEIHPLGPALYFGWGCWAHERCAGWWWKR